MARVIGILAFVAVLALLQCRGTAADEQNRFFLLQNPADNMLVSLIKFVDEKSDILKCQIISDPAVVELVKKITGEDNIVHPSVDQMEDVRKICEESMVDKAWAWNEEARHAEDEDVLLEQEPGMEEERGWDVTVPGTKWCGDGASAKNDDDLGHFADTDRCCRAHDKCDDFIIGGGTKYNLTNDSKFTKVSCKCDTDFYNCLKATNKVISYSVGVAYFSVLRRECFEERHPPTGKCKRSVLNLGLTCLEYEVDTSKPKYYQWIKAQFYYKK